MMIGTVLEEIRSFVNKHDDDIVDRYNHRYTVMILSIFILVIATKQYFGEPIVCWTHGTYPVGGEQPYHTVDRNKVLPYYQWVPFILLFQAACFMVPNVLWHTFGKSTGIDVSSLGKNALALDNFDMEARTSTIDQIARHIHISLSLKYDYKPRFKRIDITSRLPFGRRHGNYLFVVYMLVKVAYLCNAVLQLFLMNSFFGFHYHSYGVEFMRKFLVGDDYSRIDRAFPRVTFCDFKIRNMGDNIHQHSVQCALPINLFNEKFFIMFWFWLVALTMFTVMSFCSWFKMLLPGYRKTTIAQYLRSQSRLGGTEKERHLLDSFVDEYCHLDGAFIFEMLRRNSNFITTSEIVSTLWTFYLREHARSSSSHQLKSILVTGGGRDDQNEADDSGKEEETSTEMLEHEDRGKKAFRSD